MGDSLSPLPWHAARDFDGEGLELLGFRVWSFRSVRDSGYVPLSSTTALVGRQQSGKSTLLHGLCGLDPRRPEPFLAERDWPRGRRPRPRGDQIVCAGQYRLRAALRDDLVNEGLIAPEVGGIELGRSFDNGFQLAAHGVPWLDEPLKRGPLERGPLERGPLERGSLPPATEAGALLERLLPHVPPLLFADPDTLLPDVLGDDVLAGPGGAFGPADSDPVDSERRGLRGLAVLAAGASAPGERLRHLNERLSTLGLSQTLRLTPDRGLLRVSFQSGSGWRPLRQLPVMGRYLLTLDLRIAAAREAGQPAPVLVLDGPGRAFRGGLRSRLSAALERYVAAGLKVIYSARLPFHIELQHPEQVLVLAPRGPHGDHDRAAEFVVRAALGMQGRSSFAIDEQNLVVEGPTDAGILRALAGLLRASGEPSLPPDLNIISAGGAFEVATTSAFLARQGLGVVALFDSDAAGAHGLGQLEALERSGSLPRPVAGFQIGDAAGLEVDGATIEDLFPAREYLDAIRTVDRERAPGILHELEKRLEDQPPEHLARWLRRAYRARGLRFPKVEAAEELERRLGAMSSIEELEPGCARSVRELMAQLRTGLRSQGPEPPSPEPG